MSFVGNHYWLLCFRCRAPLCPLLCCEVVTLAASASSRSIPVSYSGRLRLIFCRVKKDMIFYLVAILTVPCCFPWLIFKAQHHQSPAGPCPIDRRCGPVRQVSPFSWSFRSRLLWSRAVLCNCSFYFIRTTSSELRHWLLSLEYVKSAWQ